MRTVCDVGSGMGGFARSLLERSPNVHVTQFDLPNTIALAKQVRPPSLVRVYFD